MAKEKYIICHCGNGWLHDACRVFECYTNQYSINNTIMNYEIQENSPIPERCADWERHEHTLNLDPGKWISDTRYVFPKCADNKACCIHWLKLIMGALANDGMRPFLFWIQWQWRDIASEHETEVVMEIMTDILSKKEKHQVMMTIIDAYYDTKENWASWVSSGKLHRGQTEYFRMKEGKRRLSKAFGLTDEALKMYETARKKRVKRSAVKERMETIKKDKGFSIPQVCSDISSHSVEYGSFLILYDASWFDEKICCRYQLRRILSELLRKEGLEDYINHIISTKRILKFRPKQLRVYLGTEIKILNECDHNKVMECLGKLYTETGLKLQENEREVNVPEDEDGFRAIYYLNNKQELLENKKRLSVLTRLIRKLA